MARIRSVHPDICVSETIEALDDADLEVTFTRLWTHCDDHGRCVDNLLLIKAAIYPLRERVTSDVLDAWLNELERAGLIIRYQAGGKGYISVRSWDEFQHPNRPKDSKYPAPPSNAEPPRPKGATPPDGNEHGPVSDASVTGSAAPEPTRPDRVDALGVHKPGIGGPAEAGTGLSPGHTPHHALVSDASVTQHVRDTAGEGGEKEREKEREGESEGEPSRASTALTLVPDNISPPPAAVRTNNTRHSSDFEAWWTLYPRKEAKPTAATAWRKARGHATWDQLIEGLKTHLAAWQTTDPQYIPRAAKWLNERRWEDEPPAPRRPANLTAIEAALRQRGSA